MKLRRLGLLKYTQQLLEDDANALQELYKRVIPLRIDYNVAEETYLVTAYSTHFREVPIGCKIPTYQVVFTKVSDPTTLSFSLKLDFNEVDS